MSTKIAKHYTITGKLWIYPGESARWHFFTIPKKESTQIKEHYKAFTKGWGSLPVSVTLGKTTWKTSIFPDSQSGTYLLPIKASVRTQENIFEGDTIRVTVEILVP